MHSNLTPAELSEQLASSFVEKTCPKNRKARGQFFTPLPVARFMADLAEYRKRILRVLDAGGGTGTLSCAVCEAAARRKTVKRIEIDTYEDSPSLARFLRHSLQKEPPVGKRKKRNRQIILFSPTNGNSAC